MSLADPLSPAAPVRTLEEIHEPAVRDALCGHLARPETLGLMLCGSRVLGWADAVRNPSIETATHLREHLKSEMRHAGLQEVDDLVATFARTFLPERRAAVYRDSYL